MPQDLPPSPLMMKKPKEEIGLIQGQVPDSINEWYVYLALERLDLAFMYQFAIDGGRSVRGGQVIDFVVFTPIGTVPVFVQGAYWHTPRNDPELPLKLAAAAHYFKTQPVDLSEEETSTREKALRAVREKVKV